MNRNTTKYKIELLYDSNICKWGCLIRALDTTQTNWFISEEDRDQFVKEARAELNKSINTI